jgi:hypothetical protein
MKSRPSSIYFICCCLVISLMGCNVPGLTTSKATPTEVWQEGMPRAEQPAFPALGQYWIVDGGCSFDLEKVKIADAMFEKLRQDGIAEVAIICQKGIVDKGGTNDDKIWLRDWARWARMGSAEDSRSVVWLIRPDAKPEEQRVSVEISRWLYWYTAMEYADSLNEAANYANAGDFNGALVSLARNTNEKLRQLWITHQPTLTGAVVQ